MKRSKLEIYAHARFGPPDEADAVAEADPRPAPPVRRAPPRRRERRGGLGVLGTIRLVLMLGPMAILAAGPLLIDCGRPHRTSWMPEILRRVVCTRHEITDRASTLEAQLRAVASGFR